MKESLIDKSETEKMALAAIKKAGKPVSANYIAHATGLAWHQARALLFKLTAEGKLRMLNTTNSWVFDVNDKPGQGD
jgi:predicted ArsR family transcriptional regulator